VVVGAEELGKERILRTSAADAPDIVLVVLVNVASRDPVRSVRHRSAIGPYSWVVPLTADAHLAHVVNHTQLTSSPESVSYRESFEKPEMVSTDKYSRR